MRMRDRIQVEQDSNIQILGKFRRKYLWSSQSTAGPDLVDSSAELAGTLCLSAATKRLEPIQMKDQDESGSRSGEVVVAIQLRRATIYPGVMGWDKKDLGKRGVALCTFQLCLPAGRETAQIRRKYVCRHLS